MAEPAVSLLALPHIDPGRGRVHLEIAPGATIAQMIAMALPGLTEANRDSVRVTVGGVVYEPGLWHLARPRRGSIVVIRVIPGKGNLRSLLMVVVSVAAIAAGQFYAPAALGSLGLSFGSVGAVNAALGVTQAVITGGVLVAGTLLVNALVPIRTGLSQDKGSPTYTIEGWQNTLNPDGPVPCILGTHRVAPVYATKPYTEVIGDDVFVRAAFLFGYGPLTLSDYRIGDTPLTDFTDYELEERTGLPDDLPLDLIRQQVLEERLSVRLTQGTAGTIPASIRVTASDVSAISVDIAFPSGLVEVDDEGDDHSISVTFRIRYRKLGDVAWTTQSTPVISASSRTAFVRTIYWEVADRDRYEVEVLRLTDEVLSSTAQVTRSDWVALRSFRPEYPINFDKPLALVALRIKATSQLNGMLDTFNAVAERIAPDWDRSTDTWIERETRNPASLFRYVLQSGAFAYPLEDSELDLSGIQDWHEFCEDNGLYYDRVHDFEASVWDVLADICAAGRATPQDQGDKWGVVVDTTKTKVVAHISPRNSWDFEGNRNYIDPPDAFLVKFLDAEADYEAAERVVKRPGLVGDPVVTEALELPGVTDATQAYLEGYRRFLELQYRPDTYTVNQDVESLIVTRGDLAVLNHDVIDRMMVSARVQSVSGSSVTIGEPVTMVLGRHYVVRFRHIPDGDAPASRPALSLLRSVSAERSLAGIADRVRQENDLELWGDESGDLLLWGDQEGNGDVLLWGDEFEEDLTNSGTVRTIALSGTGQMPRVGDLALFASAVQENLEVIVKGVERGENLTARITLIDHAPEIEEALAAVTVPAWDGRVGDILSANTGLPSAPVIVSIVSGILARDNADTVPPGGDRVIVTLKPGSASAPVKTYEVDHRLNGAGSWNTVTVQAYEGEARFTGYAVDNIIDIRARALNYAGSPGPDTATVQHTFGSGVELVTNGSMASTSGWLRPTGWSIASGVATKTAGNTNALSRPLNRNVTVDGTYRVTFAVTAYTAGTITPRLVGSVTLTGTARSAVGTFSEDFVATASGPMDINMLPNSAFAGSIDNVSVKRIS